MRLMIDQSAVKFRVAGLARPRQVSKSDPTQKTTPDSDGRRPIWVVRLLAVESTPAFTSTEQIWVEVAGEMPDLVVDELATVTGLVFTPWVSNKKEIMRAFRAQSITTGGAARRSAA